MDVDELKTPHSARLCPTDVPIKQPLTLMRHCRSASNYRSRSFCIPSVPSMGFLFIRIQVHPTLVGPLGTTAPTRAASNGVKNAKRCEVLGSSSTQRGSSCSESHQPAAYLAAPPPIVMCVHRAHATQIKHTHAIKSAFPLASHGVHRHTRRMRKYCSDRLRGDRFVSLGSHINVEGLAV